MAHTLWHSLLNSSSTIVDTLCPSDYFESLRSIIILRLDTFVRSESKDITTDRNRICRWLSNGSLNPTSAFASTTRVQATPIQTAPVLTAPFQTTSVQSTPLPATFIETIPVQSAVMSAPTVKNSRRHRGFSTNSIALCYCCISHGLKRLSARAAMPLIASIVISSTAFRGRFSLFESQIYQT